MSAMEKEMPEAYIRNLLKRELKSYGITDKDITQELIDMKREDLAAKRALRAHNAYVKEIKRKGKDR